MKYKESLKIIVEAIEQLDKVRDYFEDNDYKNAWPEGWSGPWPDWKNRTSKDGYLVLFTYAGALMDEMEDIFKSVDLWYEANSFYESFNAAFEHDTDIAGDNDVEDLTLGDLNHVLKWVDRVIIFLEKTERLLKEQISLEENFQSIAKDSLNKAYIVYEKGNKAKDDLNREARNLTKTRVSFSIGGETGKSHDSHNYVGTFYESLYYLRRNSKNGLIHVIDSDVYDDLSDVVDQIIDNFDLRFDRERSALRWLESWHDDAVEVIEEIIEQLENQL